ncbi:hypothetical protein INS49_014323 [Diaporthe citri]|uniref:uncharacterized protein n=1 Tax=Diaporthe citri TaxID=83186 RepID=UPI001C7F0FBE|nr:uncharacterized protein INS49_014323 [Diaporthe citri]KAG6358439.1 hypothetical protein INS49_014323 [Diaporthe citri]
MTLYEDYGVVTALGMAIKKYRGGCLDLISKLLSAGGNVDMPASERREHSSSAENCFGQYSDQITVRNTALLDSIETKSLPLVELLVSKGADVRKEAKQGLKRTPLQKACEVASHTIVDLLLELNVDINAAPAARGGGTALQLAAKAGSMRSAKKLLALSANVNAPGVRFGGRSAIDVVFVHGLTGHRERTWPSASGNAPWDAGFLPEKLQNIRLMTFGYDADVANRPIVFVCRSLGGLICKDVSIILLVLVMRRDTDGSTKAMVHANHIDMMKFDGPDDPGFKSLQGELCRWAGSVEQETESRRIEDRLKKEGGDQELEKKVQDLVKRLEFPTMHQRLNAIRSITPEQSCSWLFENFKYQGWVSCSAASQSAFLIIKGKPGAGKYVGMKAAAGRLVHSHEQSHAKLTVQFFFDGRQNTEPELWQSSLRMYRLLLCELLRNIRPFPEGILNNEALLRSGNIDAVRDAITAILTTTRTTKLSVYLFLDAIDECKADGGDGSLDMLEHLHILSQKLNQTQTSLQVCLSVRSGYKLGAALPKGNIIIVDEHNQGDIKEFVQSKLVNVNESGLRVMLERIILDKASGIFQWVDLVVWKILSKVDCETNDELLRHAEELPVDILELYAHLLNSDDPDHAAERLRLFQLLLVAREPLGVSLLRDALSSGNYTFVQDLEKFSQRLTVISSGLVQTERQQAKALLSLEKSDGGDPGYVVNFIHQTAREFLLSDSGLRRIGMYDEYGVETRCHYTWSRLCVDVLESADLSAEPKSCLLQYTCRFWMDHMRDSDIIPVNKDKYPDLMIRCGRLRTKQLVRRFHETLHRSSTQNRLLLRE